MAYFIGQLLAFLIIAALIYYPIVKPLTLLEKGDKIIQRLPNERKLAKQKITSIIITIYHLALSLFILIFAIVKTYNTNKILGGNFFSGSDFSGMLLIFSIIIIITICFGVTLFYLLNKKNNTQNLLKLGYIIPVHCVIGIFFSFFLWGHLFFNLDQKLISILPLSMLIFELIYFISIYRFQRQTGVIWPKTKTDKSRPSIKENDSIENQEQAKRNICKEETKNLIQEETKNLIRLETHTNLSAISEDTKDIKKSNTNLNHSQSPDQKAKTIIFLSSYLLILPLAASFGLFFIIEYLDKNGLRVPSSITKNLWIPIAAIALWNLLSFYTFIKTTYYLIFEIPTEKSINAGKDTDFDYRLFTVLWLMFIGLIFFILGLFLNYYL